jgi:hypothetical protein
MSLLYDWRRFYDVSVSFLFSCEASIVEGLLFKKLALREFPIVPGESQNKVVAGYSVRPKDADPHQKIF